MGKEMTLKEFVAQRSQAEVALMMGVTQGAVSQMLKSQRDIRVRPDPDSETGFRFYEVRPIGKNQAA
ncbi:hypothetical protein MKP05_09525 [Halomonas sp. EGI 63088]|uniref:Uncharacterized protein n=1 Tax=Halomonas flagellata TaxID=2920385 RepID=A0ABS9RU76_9GAMM|nr:Cro/CI family transcriptional regulator [Halomonas flagellata]MCH4563369.1 hypothetical protein [Halomonas flagellata]